MVRIFITGATGYIGGETLHQLSSTPHSIHALVRDSSKASLLKAAYPSITTVTGDLDSPVVAQEASSADIVLHLATTYHLASSQAIVSGLTTRSSPTYWIQIGGASMFSGEEIAKKQFGEHSDKVWNDADIDEIRALIDADEGRKVNQLVMSQEKIRTALIPGPLFYGEGRGVGNRESMQLPALVRESLKNGAWMVGKGRAAWSICDVRDLGRMVMILVEKAVRELEGEDVSGWNREGVYFPENGDLRTFGEIASLVAKTGVKAAVLDSENVRSLGADEADKIMSRGSVLLGTNAKVNGKRAREMLGWEATCSSLEEEIERLVKKESGGNL